MVRVQVTAPVRPTEDVERVVQAATAFWPDAQVERGSAEVRAVAHGLEPFRDRIWQLRIIDTVRGALLAGAQDRTVRVALSKQAAYAGRISLPPAPHALGDLDLVMELDDEDPWDDAEALVWWLCPATRDGEIVSE